MLSQKWKKGDANLACSLQNLAVDWIREEDKKEKVKVSEGKQISGFLFRLFKLKREYSRSTLVLFYNSSYSRPHLLFVFKAKLSINSI